MKVTKRLIGVTTLVLALTLIVGALLSAPGPTLAESTGPDASGRIGSQAGLGFADTVRGGFSYQGRLTDKNTGMPLNGQYDMRFQFWDAETGGGQIGGDVAMNGVAVTAGLFNVTIDVADGFFDGTALWLRLQVEGEWLAPRREILPVPYALSLWPGAFVRGEMSDRAVLLALNEGTGHGVAGVTQAETEWADAGVYGYSVYTESYGVLGESEYGVGVQGRLTNVNNTNTAVVGWNEGGGAGVHGYATYTGTTGVIGESQLGNGVLGLVLNPDNANSSVAGWNAGGGRGVSGYSAVTHGVYGETFADTGYFEDAGVYGYAAYTTTFGVLGENRYGIGVEGRIKNVDNKQPAIVGWHDGSGHGVSGYSASGIGVLGTGDGEREGVYGQSAAGYGVYGRSDTTYGVATADGMLSPNFDVGFPDVAEFFPASTADLEPGDVVVIDSTTSAGFALRRAGQPYDTAVAGIVSSEPGITLGTRDGDIIPGDNAGEVPLALVGRVPCKVDAGYGAIAVGDLLTSSATPGHAMRCDDRLACVGAIIGKALEPLDEGTGVIMVLVTLQ